LIAIIMPDPGRSREFFMTLPANCTLAFSGTL